MLEVRPREAEPKMPPGVDISQASQAHYLKWGQWHKGLKATCPDQRVTDILISGQWPLFALISILIG